MSIKINLAITTLALGIASISGSNAAHAQQICDNTWHHAGGIVSPAGPISTKCYYLPTVSNGRVTGLQKQVQFRPDCIMIYGPNGKPTGFRRCH